jgi:hypothetical protein
MTNNSTVNYRELFFEYTDLDRIHGEPNPENLLRFQKQLKANARTVYSNLGNDSGLNHTLFEIHDSLECELAMGENVTRKSSKIYIRIFFHSGCP